MGSLSQPRAVWRFGCTCPSETCALRTRWTQRLQRACILKRAFAGTDQLLGRRSLRERHIGLRLLRRSQIPDASLNECLVQGLFLRSRLNCESVDDSTFRRCPSATWEQGVGDTLALPLSLLTTWGLMSVGRSPKRRKLATLSRPYETTTPLKEVREVITPPSGRLRVMCTEMLDALARLNGITIPMLSMSRHDAGDRYFLEQLRLPGSNRHGEPYPSAPNIVWRLAARR